MKRTATATWNGSGKDGGGLITTESKILNNTSYTWRTRFQDVEGTSPEELLAAAHASCFTMKLSFVFGDAGFTPDMIETTSTVSVDKGHIHNSHLVVKAKVPGITPEKFQECVMDARDNCPVSRVFLTQISSEAILETEESVH